MKAGKGADVLRPLRGTKYRGRKLAAHIFHFAGGPPEPVGPGELSRNRPLHPSVFHQKGELKSIPRGLGTSYQTGTPASRPKPTVLRRRGHEAWVYKAICTPFPFRDAKDGRGDKKSDDLDGQLKIVHKRGRVYPATPRAPPGAKVAWAEHKRKRQKE